MRSAAFSPDGKRIVTASEDKTARLWDAETGKPIGEPLTGHADAVSERGVQPRRQAHRVGSYDNTLRLWDVLDSWADELCAKLPRNMTHDEWKKWVGDISYRRQCPNLPGPPDDVSAKTQATNAKR